MFVRLLFLVLVFVLFAAFVSHCVPPLVLPVIFLPYENLCSYHECYQKNEPKARAKVATDLIRWYAKAAAAFRNSAVKSMPLDVK